MNILIQYWKILNAQQKFQGMIFMFIMLITVLLETFSIGVLVSLFTVLSSENTSNANLASIKINEYLNYFINIFIDNSFFYKFSFFKIKALIIMFFLIILYFIKSLFLTFATYYQAHYTWGIQKFYAPKLFNVYLNQPYLFHKNTNSSILIRNITSEVNNFSKSLMSIFHITTDFLLLFMLILIMIYYENFLSYIILSIILVLSLIFYFSLRPLIFRWSKLRIILDRFRLQSLFEGFGNIKHIIMNSNQSFIREQFKLQNSTVANIMIKLQFIKTFPKHWFEFFAVIILSLVFLYFILNDNNIKDAVVSLTIILIIFVRIGPIIMKLINNFQVLVFLKPSINIVKNDLFLKIANSQFHSRYNLKKSIRFVDLSFSYEERGLIFNNINLIFKINKSYGIVGSSGSGKSTLVDLLSGLISPTKGEIFIDDNNLEIIRSKLRNSIGYVSQNFYIIDNSIKKNIAFGVSENDINENKILKVLNIVNLRHFVVNLTEGIETFVGEKGLKMSGGQLQRLAIARALYFDPEILILDEATNSLDKINEKKIISLIHEIQNIKLKIIISHNYDNLEKCDNIYKIEKSEEGGFSVFEELNR